MTSHSGWAKSHLFLCVNAPGWGRGLAGSLGMFHVYGGEIHDAESTPVVLNNLSLQHPCLGFPASSGQIWKANQRSQKEAKFRVRPEKFPGNSKRQRLRRAPAVSLPPPEEAHCHYLCWLGQEISQSRFDPQGDA